MYIYTHIIHTYRYIYQAKCTYRWRPYHLSRYKPNVFKLNGLNRRDKISFGAMRSLNILFLTALLEKLSDKLG